MVGGKIKISYFNAELCMHFSIATHSCKSRVEMLTPHPAEKLVVCAAFNWLRGLEPLATTPWQRRRSV